ncbi:hypothetical protein EG68_09628 [Paragonimus skrjabini miyazakii]|uniref:Uncharacterized protein n=1 Tax=Paragonimus skrjabini miyazakii TaxID=59628 RepID=A0A8S9YRT0_9TREM|nr:hypothetical protein EG68_09628 [Paragonimus skrjabini miyazakii]
MRQRVNQNVPQIATTTVRDTPFICGTRLTDYLMQAFAVSLASVIMAHGFMLADQPTETFTRCICQI